MTITTRRYFLAAMTAAAYDLENAIAHRAVSARVYSADYLQSAVRHLGAAIDVAPDRRRRIEVAALIGQLVRVQL